MTSDQASSGLKHEYYHLQDLRDDPFQMTRPSVYSVFTTFDSIKTNPWRVILNKVNLHMIYFTPCVTFWIWGRKDVRR